MSQSLIRAAFESRLATWAAAQTPSIPLSFENASFVQPAGVFLEAFLLPAATTAIDLSRALVAEKGVFQITIANPPNAGTKATSDLITALQGLFPATLIMLVPTAMPMLRIWLTQPLSVGPARPTADRYNVVLSAPYQALST